MTAAPAGGGLAEVLALLDAKCACQAIGGLRDPMCCDCPAQDAEAAAVNYLRSHGAAIAALPAKWRNDAETGVFTNGSGDAFREALNDCADELDAAIAKAGGQQHG